MTMTINLSHSQRLHPLSLWDRPSGEELLLIDCRPSRNVVIRMTWGPLVVWRKIQVIINLIDNSISSNQFRLLYIRTVRAVTSTANEPAPQTRKLTSLLVNIIKHRDLLVHRAHIDSSRCTLSPSAVFRDHRNLSILSTPAISKANPKSWESDGKGNW